MNEQQIPVMTDEQIEQTLELCSDTKKVCDSCPLLPDVQCEIHLIGYALALIKRLKAECDSKEECYNDEYNLRKDIQRKLKELEQNGRKCYCTNEVPETDCEGCNFVLTCSNNYGLSER